MELFDFSGYILASIAYFIFILLLLAAHNKTLSGRLVLLASFATFATFSLGALQLQQHFSLQLIFAFETLKILCWSLLVLSTRENIASFRMLFSKKPTKQYLIIWLTLS
ncbi:MAG: PEP-CTERM system histidine kinase PrsK, partial [Pseudomonadota bacterium]